MAAMTKNDFRDYVMEGARQVAQGYVLLDLKHNLTPRNFAEIQFHTDSEIEDVKFRLYSFTGTKPEFMQLQLHGVDLVDGTKLGAYGPRDHDILHVIDHDPHSVAANGGLDDVSQVTRYVMTEEDYAKRPNTYRTWKAEQLAKDPNWIPPWIKKELLAAQERRQALGPMEPLESVQARFTVGQRCQVSPGGRRGVVAYVGTLGKGPITNLDGSVDLPQVMIGVALDEPSGKNDGSYKDKKIFECRGKGYGIFVKPSAVAVGDYPEKDPFASDDEEEGGDACGCGGADGHKHGEDDGEDVMEEL